MFRLGYNTNGLAHHRLLDSFELLAELGYEGVAITPDVGELDLYHLRPQFVAEVRRAAEDHGLSLAIETGARFVLDPRRKHRPNLLEESAPERDRRVDFLRRSIDLANALDAEIVSLWSGASPTGEHGDAASVHPSVRGGAASARASEASSQATEASSRAGDASSPVERTFDRLCAGLLPVLDHARSSNVRIAFEPEPGMFIERPSGYLELVRRLGARGDELGLCLDVGHLLVTGDLPVGKQIETLAPRLLHIHLDDVAGGVHEHRMFGEGELDLVETIKTLIRVGYAGMAAVELSRDSHRGAQIAAAAMAELRRAILHTT
jgi:sugar phosphate isomerase/epimerase